MKKKKFTTKAFAGDVFLFYMVFMEKYLFDLERDMTYKKRAFY